MMRTTLRRALTAVALMALLFGCKNFERYTPHLVTIGGAVLQVVALNYAPVEYAPAVNLLMGTLTQTGASAAAVWAQDYRRQKELAALERIEQEIREEQAALERARSEAAGALSTATAVVAKGAPRADAEPLAADVALLRVRGDEPPAPLRDGDALHDGRAGKSPAEGLRVLVRPSRDAHLYVVAVDAVGRVQPLHPSAFDTPSAPVAAGNALLLPSAKGAYGLDEYRGVQHVFVYASEAPNSALEAQLARFARAPLPKPAGEKVYVVSEPTLVERGPNPDVRARGLTNVRPAASVALDAANGPLSVIAERSVARPGESLVVTRWFEHR